MKVQCEDKEIDRTPHSIYQKYYGEWNESRVLAEHFSIRIRAIRQI